MSKFERKKVLPRYTIIAVVLTLIGFAVLAKATFIMTAEKPYWDKVAERLTRDSLTVKPTRGNILSSDGQLMAASIPEFKLYIDFQAGDPKDTVWTAKRDSIWQQDIDSLCLRLSQVLGEKTPEQFKAHLEEGRHKVNSNGTVGSRHWPVWPRRVDYNTFCTVKSMPYLRLPKNKGGFHYEEFNARRKPFGSLAERTVGDMYGAKDTARFGLELSFDSLLRGQSGIVHHRKVRNKYLDITVAEPIDGADIVTTIDVGIQDLAERAVLDELKLINGDMGVAIVMEVATGDIKAIVNMERAEEGGEYRERVNRAVSFRCEPGSVFKTASILAAIDDGVTDTTELINTESGIKMMHGRPMKDHNWHRGGYGTISVARSLEVSSNIGVSYIIDKYYAKNPAKYVEKIYSLGLHDSLPIPIQGYRPAYIRMPDTKTTERGRYWSKTTLPWMSIGYETQIAPINTVTFYNAIANNGKMMAPRFVKEIRKDGQVIRRFDPIVMREQIAKPQSIATIQTVLEHVVSQGLGAKAGSKKFKVAGKTGTAQVADESGGYHSGTTRYWLSFAGFFPADNPRYTCLVCLKKKGLPASGGGMSGVVFHQISEGIMSQHMKLRVDDARDSTAVMLPEVKNGNITAVNYVLGELGISHEDGGQDGMVWGTATQKGGEVSMTAMPTEKGVMPDVCGMGARDAVLMLEQMGLRVRLTGSAGRVHMQSIKPGTKFERGTLCSLLLN